MKIKKILVSQPKPELERSPYFEIARNFNIEMSFRPFVEVEGIPARDFRKNRVDILSYTAVIMTSKNAVDHFFRICNEMRIIVPETMKYFCISEATAYYLQKYIQFRKRKIFFSNYSYADLIDMIRKKHKDDKFLLPCSDAPNEEYTSLLEGLKYAKAPLYRAVLSNLSDINFSEYDMVVLFSSAGVTSLFNSFPDYKQNETVFAAFGEQTAKAATEAGLKLHLIAPQQQAPSMPTAMDLYLKGELPELTQQIFSIKGKRPVPRTPKPKVVKKVVAPALPISPKPKEESKKKREVPVIKKKLEPKKTALKITVPPKKTVPKLPVKKIVAKPTSKKAKPVSIKKAPVKKVTATSPKKRGK